ncbi:Hsp20/alpha crystallin family protein [Candidatus Saccharibacteria bacterium]|nr:Hsp20/alpha crystallin family protein [Candidatus Saccharibacteria bacterium]
MARKSTIVQDDDDLVVDDSFLDMDESDDQNWIDGDDDVEGQLNVDVYQTKTHVVIMAPIAGISPDKLDIAISDDVVTIRGSREEGAQTKGRDYYIQECFWGSFSRSVILPTPAIADKAEAKMENGVVTIKIPKVAQEKVRKIKVVAA